LTNDNSPELVFVVDVTSFTKDGFAAKTTFEGEEITIEFDEENDGIHLRALMAEKISAKRGSELSVIVEDGTTQVVQTKLTGIGTTLRISDAKVYYAIGREGGAVIRVRKT
jgi:hypothetical protein